MRASSFAHKVGLGLRPSHYEYLLEKPNTEVAWFEAISENHMYSQGDSLEILQLVRQDYPIALQGLSMNLGYSEGLRLDYLQNLRNLVDRIDPFMVSDHFCWAGTLESNLNCLLPLPYTKESIETLAENIDFAQNFLRRPLALKNISNYIDYQNNEMSEWEFISEVSQKSGCGLVLDLNSVYINSRNLDFDLSHLLSHIPFYRIVQVQLAGPSQYGDFLFDDRSQEIPSVMWDEFKLLAPLIHHLPILISRDKNIPEFPEMENEIMTAVSILEKSYEIE